MYIFPYSLFEPSYLFAQLITFLNNLSNAGPVSFIANSIENLAIVDPSSAARFWLHLGQDLDQPAVV